MRIVAGPSDVDGNEKTRDCGVTVPHTENLQRLRGHMHTLLELRLLHMAIADMQLRMRAHDSLQQVHADMRKLLQLSCPRIRKALMHFRIRQLLRSVSGSFRPTRGLFTALDMATTASS
jgi:hypothetical protein